LAKEIQGELIEGLEPRREKFTEAEVLNWWNHLAEEQNLPPIKGMTPDRRTHLKARLEDRDAFFHDMEHAIRDRNWRGKNGRPFPTFDQAINLRLSLKLLEGQYSHFDIEAPRPGVPREQVEMDLRTNTALEARRRDVEASEQPGADEAKADFQQKMNELRGK